jgi:hypothetical protein
VVAGAGGRVSTWLGGRRSAGVVLMVVTSSAGWSAIRVRRRPDRVRQERCDTVRHIRSSTESWSIASRHTQNVWRVDELPAVTGSVHHPLGPLASRLCGHRSGHQVLDRVDELELRVLVGMSSDR